MSTTIILAAPEFDGTVEITVEVDRDTVEEAIKDALRGCDIKVLVKPDQE